MGGIGNAIQGLVGATTPQNNYAFNSEGQNYGDLLAGTQAQTAQNQANQNALGQQLLAQSQGQGPNPAQMQLQQALNQNQQNQAGAIASQKGINPGLAQKQIMTNSANQAQQAAGQGALMGAQQQLAAQNQLSGLYNQIGNQNLVNQGQYEGGLNSANNINSGVAAGNAKANQTATSGLFNGIGGAGQLLMKAGPAAAGAVGGSTAAAGGLDAGGGGASTLFDAAAVAAHGGEIPDMNKMMELFHGKAQGLHAGHPVMMALKAQGGAVPGQEVVSGNSSENDIVPAMLSAKEIVLPKTVTMSEDPGEAAKAFVSQIKSKTKKGDTSGYAKVLAAKRKVS